MEPRRERNVQAVVFAVFALAVSAEAIAVVSGGAPGPGELVAGAMLFALIVASRLFPLHIGYKRKMLTDSGSLFAAALILQPWAAGAVAGGGMAVAELFSQRTGARSLKQLVFNASQRLLSVMAAAVAFHSLTTAPLSEPSLPVGIASGVAVVAMFAVNDLLLLGVILTQVGRSILRDWLTDRSDIPYDIALYASGFVVALAASFHLWLLPLLIFPVVVFHRAMRTQVTLRTQTREAVEALADVVDMRDPYTFHHSHRVAEFARGISVHLGLSQDVVEEIAAAARVHDVGKIGVRDAVLLKAGPLTEEEYAEIKRHPDIGARLTARFPDFGRGTAYIRHHHERWDGAGYPLGLRGEQIPLGARIIAVADTYDALTSSRVYRPALSDEVARAELARVAGTQLDPEAVAAFFAFRGWEPVRAGAIDACRAAAPASATPA
ncbi:HD-GYP domain-containing protein [bacterium]|nr:MAG: HD-GYP domain-containing protein [bacterium]MCL4230212.1 HD-GYP domain-containing protein [Dehalococcoidia bacterium]